MPRLLISAFLLIGLSGFAFAQQTKILTADKHNEYGLVYNLPKTALEIHLKAKRTLRTEGPYFQYAKKFTGNANPIMEESEHWELVSVEVYPYGVADPEQQYLMQLKPGALTSICVGEDGMLAAINKEVKLPVIPELEENVVEEAKIGPTSYLDYVTEDFLSSQSSFKQAQMLSESLNEVREARLALTRGTAESMPKDGRQLELMLASLAHQEAAITAAFNGIETSGTFNFSCTYVPNQEGKKVLLRLADFAGWVQADDLSGEPIYIQVKNIAQAELPLDAKGEEKKVPKDAVIYNIPGSADISIVYKGQTIWSKNLELAQYGVPFGLAPTLFSDKKSRSQATFNTVTGALVEISDVDE